ncbi:beta-glucosidase [Neorhodopirellula lusitana]|uniref:Beta-glucosidase n=1 Tax=Neorhodopirellula lusitana TaxID=445327 RepID=A0ABY1Q1E1_9BACT|nr:glycoside hydrolase family 3 N-terminal domain-containing protein [Neorhodopirellula lusitana]SMP56300.1 beta-glucosidase [Neorhodopirellula lusitana]
MRNFKLQMIIAGLMLVCGQTLADGIYHDGWIDRNKNGKQDPYENPELSVEERVADLLGQMNMDEKTAQMGTIYGFKRVLKDPRPTEKWKTQVWKDGIGNIDEHCNGVKHFDENVELQNHCDVLNEIQRWFIEETRLGIPVDFTNEGIRGVCHSNASNFPTQLGVGATWDKNLVRRIGEITAAEGKALGYSNIYSPILDVVRDPRWGRTVECYGESPFHVGELGKQQCLGIQSKGVGSTVKHFATYSTPNGGRDGKGRTDPQIPQRDMHEILMQPFEKVIKEAKPWGAMSSYNTYDGVPVTGSSYFLTDLLRGEYGFNGYVVSDSGAVDRLKSQHKTAKDWETAIVHAVTAGLNVRTNFQGTEKFVLPLRKVIKDGRISEEIIDSRVADVLRVKFELGLFDDLFADREKVTEIVHNSEHEATTLEAARKAMVLLKNDGTLPLDSEAFANVLVTGPLADDPLPMISRYGPGRSDVITPLAGIKAFLGDKANVTHAKGCHYFDKLFPASDVVRSDPDEEAQAGIDEAVKLAMESDLIIACVGDTHDTVGESKTRLSLDLPGHQDLLVQELAKTGKPVIVVLMPGRATSINWIEQNIPGVLCAWHGGEKVGQAIAETLFGANNPGGKLPITFPKSVGQIPLAFPARNGAHGGQSKGHDPNGWGTSRVRGPLYPLGHGLSYTTFDYENLKIEPAAPTVDDKITITCDVTNTGDRDGDNVIQLYIRDVLGTITPYSKILRGFERVAIPAGEKKTVTFELDPSRDLKVMGPGHKWIVEPGDFDVMIAESSGEEAIKQQGSFTLK